MCRGEREEETDAAAAWGAMGASLPCGFESDDAECYAVFAALKRAEAEAEVAGRDAARERVLLLSDCAPVVAQVERALREGRAEGLRGTDRGAMLEAICAVRERLGLVVVMWCPSHVGITPNAYADAVAKVLVSCSNDGQHFSSAASHDFFTYTA